MSRVNIIYKVENNGSKEKISLPFVVGIIAELSDTPFNEFISINKKEFNKLFKIFNPKIDLNINGQNVIIQFSSIDDFNPINIVNQIDFLAKIISDRSLINDYIHKMQNNKSLLNELNKINHSLSETEALAIAINTCFIKSINQENQKIKFLQLISQNFNKEKSPYHSCLNIIHTIDKTISDTLNIILKTPKFKKIENHWRSIYNLFESIELDQVLFKVLNFSEDRIKSDLELGYENSDLFQLIHENEYGTIGGKPFSCLLFDYFFTKSSSDIKLLKELALLCEKSHAPLLSSVCTSLFNISSFDKIYSLDLKRIFEDSEYIEWNELRQKNEMRYINLCVPKVLVRQPYNIEKQLNFKESIDSINDLCFGNAAYSMMLCIIKAFNKYGWTAAIRGYNGGGLVENIPYYLYKIDNQPEMICPVDIHITDKKEREFSELGFIALCHKKMTNKAVFFSAQSLQDPIIYSDEEVTGNSLIASRLPYVLNASRFAHYLKIMIRDNIGTFQSTQQIENDLQNWIGQYVLLSDNIGDENLKAEYPLREAKVKVLESTPGDYNIKIHIRPHFQMETANITLGFVVKIKD